LRGSVYQFRVKVPVDLREAMGCIHVSQSLRTDSRSLAIRLAKKVAFEIDSIFEATRRKNGLAYDPRLIIDDESRPTVLRAIARRSRPASAHDDPDPQLIATTSDFAAPTLSAIYERYLNDPTKRRSARTMLAHHTTRRVVEDVLGSLTPISEISREACRELLDMLRWLPVNFTKKFPGLSVREATERAKNDGGITTINATNLNAYMARFATMMNWAVREEYIGRNPARGLQWAETIHPQDRRKPFAPWQLQRIFGAANYVGGNGPQNGSARAEIASGARYWVPLLALYSGARLNELCQLDVSDVRRIEGVACMVITEASSTGTRDKSLKTKSSERIVPLHPVLLDLGIMAFVEGKRRDDSTKLFDDLPLGARGFRSVAFSRWFSRFLVSKKASAPRTCFHSFRHGFRDAARNAKIERDIALRLGGWITGGNQSETADDYGSGYHPTILFDAISVINYPGLDLSPLTRPGACNGDVGTATAGGKFQH